MLPEAVEAFIDAMNRFDQEGLIATFAPDAIVNDHRCEFRGHEAIRAWIAMALFHDDATCWFPTTRKTLTMPELVEGLAGSSRVSTVPSSSNSARW
jgi:hypothetical protein